VQVRVEFHPTFASQYEQLCQNEDAADIAGEITMLLDALETHGHDIEGEATDDPSHPVVTSRYQMFALRRTPPTTHTPYADRPPVIRIPYVWFLDKETSAEVAVVMLMGDKATQGSHWYPKQVEAIETLLIPGWQHHHPSYRALTRRSR
jgi:hypothetical protein